jgi:predicted ATPase
LLFRYPEQALAGSNAAIDEARTLGHPPSLAVNLSFGAVLLSLVGGDTVLAEYGDDLLAVALEQNFPLYHAIAPIYRGWVHVKNGEVARGVSLMRRGLSAYRASGSELWTPHYSALLAAACEIASEIEEGLSLLDDALQIVERTGGRWLQAELCRHKGQLLLRQGHPEAAEQLYHKALNIAREQEARMWELRAATSVARLWGERGRRAEARELLAPVYGWFTEGFVTPYLKEAKALLDELA